MTDMLQMLDFMYDHPLVGRGTGGPPDDNSWVGIIFIVCVLIFIGIIVWCIKH